MIAGYVMGNFYLKISTTRRFFHWEISDFDENVIASGKAESMEIACFHVFRELSRAFANAERDERIKKNE